MKKIIASIILVAASVGILYSQNTNYGTGSGTQGDKNAFFGYYAGNATRYDRNTAMGWKALLANTIGYANTAIGAEALSHTTTGQFNTAIGDHALRHNVEGGLNTAVGYAALSVNINTHANTAVGGHSLQFNTGTHNTAVGYQTLNTNKGDNNTAMGGYALYWNETGVGNAAYGFQAMMENNTGHYNTATGFKALNKNTSSYNTAVGSESLTNNLSGDRNTATGYHSLHQNTTGDYNTATGALAMYSNVSGNFNAASGYYTLHANTTGTHNSAAGFRALDSNTIGTYNTAKGAFALANVTTGSYNSALGYNAGPSYELGDLTNTTALGYLAVPTASNQVRVGNAFVTSIGGQVSWSTLSDGRFKKDVREDVSGLAFINNLRPVSYVIDKSKINKFLHIQDSAQDQGDARNMPMRQTGFVAQEVEAIIKKTGYVFYGVDAPKNENDPYSIRYAEFVVPLVKAVQEMATRLEEQDRKIEFLLAQLDSKNDVVKNGTKNIDDAVLFQNNPNPFTADSEIQMTLSENVRDAYIVVYNLEGKQLKNIRVNDRGNTMIKISGNELPSGMYLYTLIADSKAVDTKRMILTH